MSPTQEMADFWWIVIEVVFFVVGLAGGEMVRSSALRTRPKGSDATSVKPVADRLRTGYRQLFVVLGAVLVVGGLSVALFLDSSGWIIFLTGVLTGVLARPIAGLLAELVSGSVGGDEGSA
ncbi:MAG: hypothetical protein Q7V53_03385 [Caldisericota bacterium]|nr:hypothetical protein [Caldisericota bacterium]